MPTTTDTALNTGTVLDAGGDPHVVVLAALARRPGYAAVLALSSSTDTHHRFAVWHAYPIFTTDRDRVDGWQVQEGGYYRTLDDAIADYEDRTVVTAGIAVDGAPLHASALDR